VRTTRRRLAAAAALVLATAMLGVLVALAIEQFPRGLIALAVLVAALPAASYGALRRGVLRVLGLGVAVLLAAAAVVLLVGQEPVLVSIAVALWLLSLAAASAAFRIRVPLPSAKAPAHPVLFYNPKSGGGKADRFHLPDEARKRGIEPVELTPAADLETLARELVAAGADALAMAGGDGSQAIVAAVAAEHHLPYACIPAGTRNHFALDLGVDREDVVGALDAFVDGGERVVDLAEVNGRVFVNNVSLGVYAEAVQRAGYRNAKVRTLLQTVPEALGEHGSLHDMHWEGPDGDEHGGAAVLVSNNPYRLGRAIGSGTRPRMDEGVLGVAVIGAAMRNWAAPSFEVEATEPVAAGIDGEAARLEPPLDFRMRPGALRVRIAQQHPGASPSARMPEQPGDLMRMLLKIAVGR
jgi:diacylglycerol kinase family enzyme